MKVKQSFYARLLCTLLVIPGLTMLVGCPPPPPDGSGTGGNLTGQIAIENANGSPLILDGAQARVGADAPSDVTDNGFSGKLRRNAPGLIVIENANGDPLLMAVLAQDDAADPDADVEIEVTYQTTAVALVYLMPLIAQDLPADQVAMLALIGSLPQTSALTEAIAAALTANSTAGILDDAGVQAALEAAIDATFAQATTVIAGGNVNARVTITPTESDAVTVVQDDTDLTLFDVTNGGRRRVNAFVLSDGSSLELGSIGSLLSINPVASPTGELTSTVAEAVGDVIDVYGLGFADGLPDLAEVSRWGRPSALTMLDNMVNPIIKLVLNVPAVPSDVVDSLATSLTADSGEGTNTVLEFLTRCQQQNYLSAVELVATQMLSELSQDEWALVRSILGEFLTEAEIAAFIDSEPVSVPTQILDAVDALANISLALGNLANLNHSTAFTLSPPPPDCGNGTCGEGETCVNCAEDCGVCPPPEPVCGDAACNGEEQCETCEQDCGPCDDDGDGLVDLSVTCVGTPTSPTAGQTINWTATPAFADASATTGATFCWGSSCTGSPFGASNGVVTGATQMTTSVSAGGTSVANVQVTVGEQTAIAQCQVTEATSGGGGGGGGGPTTFTLSVTLIRAQNQGYVTEATVFTGGVPSNPQITCPELASLGRSCVESYATGMVVPLLRYAPEGFVFIGWEGDAAACGTNDSCIITMDANKSVTARFAVAP